MKKMTHSEFITKLPNTIELLTEYVNSRTPVSCRCKKCNHEWDVNPRSLIKGHGCPECGKLKAKATKKWNVTTEDFVEKLSKLDNTIEVIGNYVDANSCIKVRCSSCGNIWTPKAKYLVAGYGCSICKSKNNNYDKMRKSHEDFCTEIQKINPYIKLETRYSGAKHPITVSCKKCNHEWEIKHAGKLHHRGCPNCNISKGELYIENILLSKRVNFSKQVSFSKLRSVKGGILRFDFGVYSPDDELEYLIEFDGVQHFEPVAYMGGKKRFEAQRKNDELKNNFCLERDIPLLRIRFDKIDYFDIMSVQSMLESWREDVKQYFK